MVSPWIKFFDANGFGYAQPDALMALGDQLFLFEAKLTETERAAVELKTLYLPLIRFLHPGQIICCIQVFKYCSQADGTHLFEVLAANKEIGTLHLF